MLKYIVFVIGIASGAICFSLPSSALEDGFDSELMGSPGTHELVFLGQVDNKTYYADNSGNMNWTQAKTLCENEGMVLATVESDAEYDFLRSTYIPGLFDLFYWTAARDSQMVSQLGWDKGEFLRPTVIEKIDIFLPDFIPIPLSCAVINNNKGYLVMQMVPCSHKSTTVGTICQTK